MTVLPLSSRTLAILNPSVIVPDYDRSSVTPGVVHLGIGAFHRAHQAVFIDDCLADGETDWGILGVSLRSAAPRDALRDQDYLYTLCVRGSEGETLRVVGSLCDILVAPEDPAHLLEAMAKPAICIVTLTVTEKAYLRNASGDLDLDHPDIIADLADPGHPRTIFGFIVGAIERRSASGIAPFTVLSCDNLASNGRTLHRLLVQFAGHRSEALAAYIEDQVSCPSTMVDRIVPATTTADEAAVSTAIGVSDAWPIVCEPFAQWIIEDRFTLGRPSLEKHGVVFVEDVRPFELMKLRLLNGAHSAIAYLGLLLGHQTVSEAFADHRVNKFVDGLWKELTPTLPFDAGLDPATYTLDLSRRFRNTALRHATLQIASDGSQKLPQRIIAAALERLERDGAIDHLAFVVAAWVAALARRHAESHFPDVIDGSLAAIDFSSGGAIETIGRIFAVAGFARDSSHRDRLIQNVGDYLTQIDGIGPARALDVLNSKGFKQ